MKPSERKEVKAGKHERIKAMLKTLTPSKPKPVEEPSMDEAVGLDHPDLEVNNK